MKRGAGLFFTALLLASPLVGIAPTLAQTSDVVVGKNCRGVFGFPSAAPDVVREVGEIPDDWNLQGVEEESDRAILAVVGLSCEAIDAGTGARPLTYATVSVFVDPPDSVSHRSTSSFGGLPGETDFYLIAWAATDLSFVRWLSQGTGLNDRVRYVRDLKLSYDVLAENLVDFSLVVPPPGPVPFRLTATAMAPTLPISPVTSNFWAVTTAGTVMIETSNPQGDHLGSSRWSVEADGDSPLGRMMEAQQASDVAAFGTEETVSGQWRKDLP